MRETDPIRDAMTAAAPLNMRVREASGGAVIVECRACGWGSDWPDVDPTKYARAPYGCGRCAEDRDEWRRVGDAAKAVLAGVSAKRNRRAAE